MWLTGGPALPICAKAPNILARRYPCGRELKVTGGIESSTRTTGLTRRALLGRGLAAVPALALGGLPASTLASVPRRADRAALPGAEALAREVRDMVELGPRLAATSPHLQFIDHLE